MRTLYGSSSWNTEGSARISNITPREVIRDFIEVLDLLYQNPGMNIEELLQSEEFTYAKSEAVSDETGKDYVEFTL